MELVDGSFERALGRHLRAELDALNVASPATARPYARRGSMRYAWAVGRTLAVGLAVALLLGSVAAFASGDPGKFVSSAERSLGIPPFDDKPPIGSLKSPSSRPSESEGRARPSSGSQSEPAESPTPEPTQRASPERESPEASPSPEPGHSPEPPEHSPGPLPGDD
jgi:hypothetical protein